MYPRRELIRLAVHKAARRRDIALHRAGCAAAGARLARPLAWVDRLMAVWRQLSPLAPFAALPLGLLLKSSSAPKPRWLGRLLHWAPVVLAAVRGLRGAARD